MADVNFVSAALFGQHDVTIPLPNVEMKDEEVRELGNRWTCTISCWALASENMQLASHCFSGGFSG